MLRLKIKVGVSEIELEGDAKEIHGILERHWEPHVGDMLSDRLVVDDRQVHTPEPLQKKSSKRSGGSRSAANRTGPNSASEVDGAFEESLANAIKNASNFPTLSKRFIIGNASLLERCKLVLSFSDKPLTSGNVLRVLTKIGIRTDAPAVSKALSNNKSQFITSGTPVVYAMTASTENAFAEGLGETKDKPQ